MAKLAKRVEELLTRPIEQAGYELWNVEYQKEGSQWFLRLFIDHPDGVGLEDCVKVNDLIEPLLEGDDPIPQEYSLEVSSPGIFRPLNKPEHFTRFIGETIRVSLFKPIGGRKKMIGQLLSATIEEIQLLLEDQEQVAIPYKSVAKANLESKLTP